MRRFGLIGRPLGHSASAAYFMEKFNREGVTDCEYSLYELGSIGDLPGSAGASPGALRAERHVFPTSAT